MTFSEACAKVIDLARKVSDYYEAELPKRHRKYPLVSPDEETAPAPLEEQELKKFLSSLPDDIVYRLILIVNLGRQYFGADDLASNFESLRETVGAPSDAVSELMSSVGVLADVLSDGLEELRNHHINVDKLPLAKVKLRKR